MSITAPVLQKDIQKKQTLDSFLKYCEQKQIEALRTHDEKLLREWIKEARLARRLYRAKEKHDVERERDRKNILKVIKRLRSQGINADLVERAHYITLCEEVS
ncbi:TPA: hypothetical protein QCR38_000799 [Bacillus cereus]|nr:hypothetical protein [Bacillus cereus]